MRITAAVMAVGLCLIVAGTSLADGTVEERQTAVKLYRGSSIIAASDPNSDVYVADFTPAACEQLLAQRWQEEARTRTSGSARYKCQVETRAVVTFSPASIPICPDKPADEQRQQTCPTGTVGAWLQDRIWTLQPYPACWTQGEWAPSDPPAGMCAPLTPPEPELLSAPTNVRAQGISTNSIRVTWDPVAGAGAYSLERCIGATCTTFSQLVCVTSPAGTHSSLPAGLAVSYRVRASRDATCSVNVGNLGAHNADQPAIVGRTLSATPVNCTVSAWSAWTAGAWSTCSGGQQSRTETRTRTVTTQPTNGGTACPVLTETRTVTQACSVPAIGTASLQWTPPTRNTDGTALTNLAGYRVHYGRDADELTQTVQVESPISTRYVIERLAPGTYFFAVRAHTSDGNESANSNVVTKVVQ